ncbi:hypothetical protein F4677DRAFT_462335 [Hypoxylon crocopeplum]|nr:hypothetical protein F4677DRAFT_462335 [Hypoxylon crocopeplum]
MATPQVAMCSHCGTHQAALQICSGCVDAPEYQPGDSAETWYCDTGCQRLHRPVHNARCKQLQKRRHLLRSANMLKATITAYRECCAVAVFTKIELVNNVLHLHVDVEESLARKWLYPFAEGLTTNTEHKEMALASNQSAVAAFILSGLTFALLKGISSQLTKLFVDPKPILDWKTIPETTLVGPYPPPHVAILVQLRHEHWVLDVTGCEYGHRETLLPATKFLEEVARRTRTAWTYAGRETTDIDVSRGSVLLRNQRDFWRKELERPLRLHFAAFVKERFGEDAPQNSVKDFLGGTAEEFQGKLDRYVVDLKQYLAEFVQRSYEEAMENQSQQQG